MAAFRRGDWVRIGGAVGIVAGIPGMVDENAWAVRGWASDTLPYDTYEVHLVDVAGETLMKKDPLINRLITDTRIVTSADLTACPHDEIPESRRPAPATPEAP